MTRMLRRALLCLLGSHALSSVTALEFRLDVLPDIVSQDRDHLFARALDETIGTASQLSSASQASLSSVISTTRTGFISAQTARASSLEASMTESTSSMAGTSTTITQTRMARIAAQTTTSTSTSTSTTSDPGICPPLYTGKTMIRGTGTLPKPTSFVTKAANSEALVLDGRPYRITGPNIYWLCHDENIPDQVSGTPPSKARIREALAIAVAMGANTVRLHTCGISVGFPDALEPARGQWARGAIWDIHDYALFAAREYGLRVILPLTDQYDYYHGGVETFLRWRGRSPRARFYYESNVLSDFLVYVAKILTRKNKYTGKVYGEDPTVLAWETGNELGAYMNSEIWPPRQWTAQVAGLIKGYAQQLVIDGSGGFYNYTTKAVAEGRLVKTVDIVSDHGYPRAIDLLQTEKPLAAAYKKNFLVGEYDWNHDVKDSLASYLSFIEKQSTTMGSMFWSIFGHHDDCRCFVRHDDGYSMYYPNGNTPAEQQSVLQVVQHQYRMTGRTPPTTLPGVACPQPAF